mmetsp:Transcript_25868/g.38257  ORF Transcript_25868/g.38257 Transcript_25868/m.38257 type:complete len:226 (-) Transcript_25868:27-704(-)
MIPSSFHQRGGGVSAGRLIAQRISRRGTLLVSKSSALSNALVRAASTTADNSSSIPTPSSSSPQPSSSSTLKAPLQPKKQKHHQRHQRTDYRNYSLRENDDKHYWHPYQEQGPLHPIEGGKAKQPKHTPKPWQAEHNVDIQRVTQTAIIHDLTQQQTKTIEQVVPWFLDNMPVRFCSVFILCAFFLFWQRFFVLWVLRKHFFCWFSCLINCVLSGDFIPSIFLST